MRSQRRAWAGLLRALALGAAVALAGCASLPSLENRPVSTVIRDTGGTRLGRAVAQHVAGHGALSGFFPLREPRDAFAARLLLMQAAERSLDVQYYIWHEDLTGTLLFDALRAAAGRGVRVRLLLDDNNTQGLDETLQVLAALPNVEVRLFNPFAVRSPRWLGYLTDFSRANRRMHNKSLTADDRVTLLGGRNVGDEYFGATDGVLFTDLDVVAIGPVVDAVSTDFDLYWASGSSYPVGRLLPPPSASARARFEARVERAAQEPQAEAYLQAMRESPLFERLASGELPLQWASARLVSDDPDKGLGLETKDERVITDLKDVIGEARREVQIVSPYFVPTRRGVDALAALAGRGVDVQVLTNSLEATDVAAVHAGYAKWRKELLRAGIRLFELRRIEAGATAADAVRPAGASGGSGARRGGESGSGGGSSASSLHAKTFATDRARVFVGSFNFDPRSIDLNTELGVVIESPALAGEVAEAFAVRVPERAYEVRLDAAGELVWIERDGARVVVHHGEPGASAWKRAWIGVLSHLPIDWLL